MAVTQEEHLKELSKGYRFGWHDPAHYVFEPKKGLSEQVVEDISFMKSEPEWMRKFRLKALKHFQGRPMPWWGADLSDIEAALELHTRRLVLDQATREGHTEAGGVAELLARSVAGDAARARELLRRSYFGGVLAVGTGPAPIDLPSLAGLPFDRLLANLAEPLLSAIHPLHREVAPRAELVGDRLLRQLIVDVIPQRRVGVAAAERGQLRPLIAGYLVPLGLVRRRGDAWVLAPDPARSPAVSESLLLARVRGFRGMTKVHCTGVPSLSRRDHCPRPSGPVGGGAYGVLDRPAARGDTCPAPAGVAAPRGRCPCAPPQNRLLVSLRRGDLLL